MQPARSFRSVRPCRRPTALLRCKKAGFKEETIRTPGQLGRCLEAIDGDARIDKAAQAQLDAVTESCIGRGVDPALAFPGTCAVSPSVGTCLAERVKCRACRALAATDGIDQDCDDVDDGLDNESCD